MFAELLAAHLVLKGWKQNPTATKREIGVWGHWKEDDEENQCVADHSSQICCFAVGIRRAFSHSIC